MAPFLPVTGSAGSRVDHCLKLSDVAVESSMRLTLSGSLRGQRGWLSLF